MKYDAENNWICRAMELAADVGMITRSNSKARPKDSITRAEALAILMKAGGISTNLTEQQKITIQSFRLLFENDISWQQNTIMAGMFHNIIYNITIDTHHS